jgi:lipid-A-disaccharide synthase
MSTVAPVTPRKIFLSAGEVSGDQHAADLVRALSGLAPDVRFIGIGGRNMAEAGVALVEDLRNLAVVGLTEVLRHFPRIFDTYLWTLKILELERPDLVILVDYPDFNFRLGQAARRLGIPVFYYISPQIWAWRRNRIKVLKRFVSRMFVVFPFEVEFYEQAGLPCEFVGNPLAEQVNRSLTVAEFRRKWNLRPGRTYVTLMPGSRYSELKRLLPVMLAAARRLHRRRRDVEFLLPVPDNLPWEDIRSQVSRERIPLTVVSGNSRNALKAADLALIKSGTSTLEAALTGTPAVVLYKLSPLTWFLARHLVHVEHVAMVNIVAGRRLVPEYLQQDAHPSALASALERLLHDEGERAAIRRGYREVADRLRGDGASLRAAQAMLRAYREVTQP